MFGRKKTGHISIPAMGGNRLSDVDRDGNKNINPRDGGQ